MQDRGSLTPSPTPWLTGLICLLTLVTYVLAQPVYEVLASNPDFVGARRVSNLQLIAVIVVFNLVPALALWLLWAPLRRLGPRFDRGFWALLICGFALSFFLQVHTAYLSQYAAFAGAYLLWTIPALALLPLALRHERSFRTFLLFLSPAILIFPGLFLARTWRQPKIPLPLSSTTVHAAGMNGELSNGVTPVFMLVFDEFAVHALLDGSGEIDADRFPNFKKLSLESDWFRNATANSSKTVAAIPAMVTGNLPIGGDANHTRYRNTLFTFLDPYYEVHIHEVGYTAFCEPDVFHCINTDLGSNLDELLRDLGYLYLARVLPAGIAAGVPDVTHTWGPFRSTSEWVQAALEQCRRTLASLDSLDGDNVLHFSHLILPHSPYALTDEGQVYNFGPNSFDEGFDEATLHSMRERYRMQVGYVDHWLGEYMARLKQLGLYDKALLIVTGDHGVSWKPQAPGRKMSSENAEMLLTVPLFIKRPLQKEGSVSKRDVQQIDLLPTIAEVLGMPLPFDVEGRSVYDSHPAQRKKVAYGLDMKRFEFDDTLGLIQVEEQKRSSPLLGRRVESFAVEARSGVRGRMESAQASPILLPSMPNQLPIHVGGWAARLDPSRVTAEVNADSARRGSYGLTQSGARGGNSQQIQGLSPGQTHQLTAWLRSPPGTRGQALLRVRPGEAAEGPTSALLAAPNEAFEPVIVDFVAPTSGTVWVDLQYTGGEGAIYWDDVSVVGEPAIRCGIEKGATPWQAFGEATSKVRSTPSFGGQASLALSGAAGGAYCDLDGLTPGKSYAVTAWAMSAPGSTGEARFWVHDTQEGGWAEDGPRAVSSTEFEPFILEFVPSQLGKMRIHLYYSGGPGAVYWSGARVAEERAENGGFETRALAPWTIYGPAEPTPATPIAVAVAVNGEIVGVTSPGAERFDVAARLQSPQASYSHCGWVVAVPFEKLQEGDNLVTAFAVLDPALRKLAPLEPTKGVVLVRKDHAVTTRY